MYSFYGYIFSYLSVKRRGKTNEAEYHILLTLKSFVDDRLSFHTLSLKDKVSEFHERTGPDIPFGLTYHIPSFPGEKIISY